MQNKYLILKESKNGFDKLQALIFLLKNNFGEEKINFASSEEKVVEECVKCIKDILKIRNTYFGFDFGTCQMIIFNNTTEEDSIYADILYHIGYENFCYDAKTILASDFVILTENDSMQDAHYFTYENIEDFGNYIEDVLSIMERECDDIDDIKFTNKISKRINRIIQQYWGNTIEFDYVEFKLNRGE